MTRQAGSRNLVTLLWLSVALHPCHVIRVPRVCAVGIVAVNLELGMNDPAVYGIDDRSSSNPDLLPRLTKCEVESSCLIVDVSA